MNNLTQSVLASLLVAVVALLVFVLPAEYDLDVLGAGELLGISGMSAQRQLNVSTLNLQDAKPISDQVSFPLAPFESVEYKFSMHKGDALVFAWEAEGEVVFDLHSEEVGTDPEDAISASVGRGASQIGTYVAPYDGIHGWFWENRGAQEVTVKLSVQGFAEESITYSPSGEYKRKL